MSESTDQSMKAKQFWQTQLSGGLPDKIIHPEVFLQTNEPEQKETSEKVVLDSIIHERLTDFCGENDFLWYCFLVSALQVSLYKYSGQKDFLLATPLKGTEKPQDYFLPLRVNIEPNTRFQEWVLQLRNQLKDSYTQQNFPITTLLEESGLSTEKKLFQAYSGIVSMAGIHPECVRRQEKLHFRFHKSDKNLTLQVFYSTNYYNMTQIKQLTEWFHHLLKTAVVSPKNRLSELSICSIEEELKIRREFNQPLLKDQDQTAVTDKLSQQFSKNRSKKLLVHNGSEWTYDEIDQLSSRLAELMIGTWQIKKGDFVALCTSRSVHYIVSMIAVLKTGAAFVPVDTEAPANRLKFIFEDSHSKLVLTDQAEGIAFAEEIPILNVAEVLHSTNHLPNAKTQFPPVEAKDIAYVLYTSGTTGKPKGALITHQNIVNLVSHLDSYFPIHTDTIMMQMNSIVFDISILEIWGTFLNGGKLIIVDKQTILDSKKLKKEIKENSINTMALPTAVFHHLATYHIDVFEGIKQLLVGGETLSPELAKKLLRQYTSLDFLNAYGPTEGTVLTTAYPIIKMPIGTVSIGKPVPQTQLLIIGVDGQIQPVGAPGEIYIIGNGVGLGYLNRVDLTAQHFILGDSTDATYKTGDLAKWHDDGTIAFLGRKDRQIKLRGYRIELKEIENCLLTHSDIVEVMVRLTENKRLCAYYVSKENRQAALESYLKERLPDYMIPSVFVLVEEIPLTISGKIDEKRLPEPERKALNQLEKETLNAEEKKLADLWATVLGIERIGMHQNFFELGGHSLNLVILTEELQKAGYVLDMMDIYKYPTIADFLEFQKHLSTVNE